MVRNVHSHAAPSFGCKTRSYVNEGFCLRSSDKKEASDVNDVWNDANHLLNMIFLSHLKCCFPV